MDKYLKNNDNMMKTRTMTIDDETHQKAKIIALVLGLNNLSALFRHFIDKEYKENNAKYKNIPITLPKQK